MCVSATEVSIFQSKSTITCLLKLTAQRWTECSCLTLLTGAFLPSPAVPASLDRCAILVAYTYTCNRHRHTTTGVISVEFIRGKQRLNSNDQNSIVMFQIQKPRIICKTDMQVFLYLTGQSLHLTDLALLLLLLVYSDGRREGEGEKGRERC